MRLPGAALLIAIGLILLFIATTGKLDRLGVAWTYITGKTTGNPLSMTLPASCDPSSGICDFSKYGTQNLLHAMSPTVAVTNPGGMN